MQFRRGLTGDRHRNRALTVRDGFTNGNEENQRKVKGEGRRAPALLAIIMVMIAMSGGMLATVIHNEPKDVDWQQEYWDHVFFHLNNTTENRNFVSDFLKVYNASDWQHFNATHDLVVKGGINPMWLARYIAGNMWSREEFNILPAIFSVNESLKNYGNLSLMLTEMNILQDGINASEAQLINNIFASYLHLTPLERSNLFFNTYEQDK